MTQQRTIRIDASSLKNSSCMLAFYRTVIEGYREPINNSSIEFGSAVHLFLTTMCQTGGRYDLAISKAQLYFSNTKMEVKKNKTYLDNFHLSLVCTKAWEWLQNNNEFEILTDGVKPATEITFSNVFYEDETVKVLLEGTVDKIGKFRNGIFAIGDYKTTSSRDKFEYFRGYECSTQLKFYIFNLLLYAKMNPSSLIAEICKNQVGAFIEGIFLNGKDIIEIARSRIFTFKSHELDTYRILLASKIQQLIKYIQYNTIPAPEGMLTDTCSKPENSSGGAWRCRYFNACAMPDKIAEGHVLKQHFIQKPYEPLKFGKEEVKEETLVAK